MPIPKTTGTLVPEEATAPPGPSGSASSLTRLLSIFDLFHVDRHTIHLEDVIAQLGVGRSTGYRYLQELTDAGFLAQLGKGVYSLGPRIVQLERLLQLTDPLLLAGRAVMDEFLPGGANRAVMLCTLFRDRVLCLHQVGAESILQGSIRATVERARGTALPLFTGAGSQIILAHLPPHRARSLYLSNQAQIADAGLGTDWATFRQNLARMRKAGFAVTWRPGTPPVAGIAVPIFRPDAQVVGSLVLLLTESAADPETEQRHEALVTLLRAKAAAIQGKLSELDGASGPFDRNGNRNGSSNGNGNGSTVR
ncbi:MAG: IclR family transcriptional regulator [Lautropia sp.]